MRGMSWLCSMVLFVATAMPVDAQDVRQVEPAALRLAAGAPPVTVLVRGAE